MQKFVETQLTPFSDGLRPGLTLGTWLQMVPLKWSMIVEFDADVGWPTPTAVQSVAETHDTESNTVEGLDELANPGPAKTVQAKPLKKYTWFAPAVAVHREGEKQATWSRFSLGTEASPASTQSVYEYWSALEVAEMPPGALTLTSTV